MNLTREERLAAFGELTKIPGIKRASVFADELVGTARILIDHHHSGRPWKILGASSIPGFNRLRSSFQVGLDAETTRAEYTICDLCLHESEFTRIQ